MAKTRTVAVVVGSLRKESFSRKLAQAIAAVAPTNLKFDFVDIGALEAFNQDLEPTPRPPGPPSATASARPTPSCS